MTAPLLDVAVTVDYPNKPAAIDRVAFTVEQGEMVGLIGQSGSGKSTLAMAILRLMSRGAAVRGSIRFLGRDLLTLPEREMREVRGGGIGLVLQSPSASMNPALRLEAHLAEAWRAHSSTRWRDEKPRVCELLATLGLPAGDEFLRRKPHQVSVGQAQRVMIAAAILHRPRLLIADEPTSALDAFSAAEVLALLHRLNRTMGMAVLFISHDLRSVAALCGRAVILDQGAVVHAGRTREILAPGAAAAMTHPAARRLLEAMHLLDGSLHGDSAGRPDSDQLSALANSVADPEPAPAAGSAERNA